MTENNRSDIPAMPEMKLELVPLPVSDVDRARDFYVGKVGFNLDHDVQPGGSYEDRPANAAWVGLFDPHRNRYG